MGVSFGPLHSNNNTLIKKPNYVRLKLRPIKSPWKENPYCEEKQNI